MPVLRVREIRGMSRADREKKLLELRAELVKLRTKIKAKGSIENPSAVKEIKRALARLQTIRREELGGQVGSETPREPATSRDSNP